MILTITMTIVVMMMMMTVVQICSYTRNRYLDAQLNTQTLLQKRKTLCNLTPLEAPKRRPSGKVPARAGPRCSLAVTSRASAESDSFFRVAS